MTWSKFDFYKFLVDHQSKCIIFAYMLFVLHFANLLQVEGFIYIYGQQELKKKRKKTKRVIKFRCMYLFYTSISYIVFKSDLFVKWCCYVLS